MARDKRSNEPRNDRHSSVLVVGGTGNLGGRAVRQLLARKKGVRALVREGTDATRLLREFDASPFANR